MKRGMPVLLAILWLAGCGGASSNPTARIASLTAEPSEVAPGGSAVITARVVKTGGEAATEAAREALGEQGATTTSTTTSTTTTATTVQPVAWGVNVAFRLLTANGGQLSATTQKTDGAGVAMVVYTAGNNASQDILQATLENDSSATLIIKKTGAITGPVISGITAVPASVDRGQQSVVTVKVTDGNTGNPVAGEYVDLRIYPNNSGAFLVIPNPYTDARGQVVATYVAGSLSDKAVTDVVQARVTSSGSVNAVIVAVRAPSTTTTIAPAAAAAGEANTQRMAARFAPVCTTVAP